MAKIVTQARSPFHAGERQAQQRLGVRDIEDWARKVVRPYLPEQHRDFHTALPFLVAAARDGEGRPWATLLAGAEGFVTSPDPRTLVIDARPVPGDALEGRLTAGADLGILGIEPATRRRNRVNGRIAKDDDGAVALAVDQTFGNCPQYVRERAWRRVEGAPSGTPARGKRLTAAQRERIAAADTFFVASGHRGAGEDPAFGMDASHRGGDPGFVRELDDRHLVFPDYAGNNHCNTIGNLLVDPRAGLLFVDFAAGGLLQMTGRTRIDWDSAAVAGFPGARRLVHFEIEETVELPAALPLRWDASAESVRSLRLVEKTAESAEVTSFVFEARDGGPLPDGSSIDPCRLPRRSGATTGSPWAVGRKRPSGLEPPSRAWKARVMTLIRQARGLSRYGCPPAVSRARRSNGRRRVRVARGSVRGRAGAG